MVIGFARVGRNWFRLLLWLLISAACAEDPENLLGNRSEPVLYLLLSPGPDTLSASGPVVDSTLYAVLATSFRPPELRHRSAENFSMRRRSDGAFFGWRANGRADVIEIIRVGTRLRDIANFELPWSSGPSGLGREALTPGDTYDLTIESEGRVLSGATVMPASPTIALSTETSGQVVHWSRSIGTVGYEVFVTSDVPSYFLTTDTMYQLKNNGASAVTGDRVEVAAAELNFWRYLSDSTLSNSGFVGGIGLFGATSKSVRQLPSASAVLTPARWHERTRLSLAHD